MDNRKPRTENRKIDHTLLGSLFLLSRGVMPNYSDAQSILHAWVQAESLRKHCESVAASMRHFARKHGKDEALWSAVGLLHDLDCRSVTLVEHVVEQVWNSHGTRCGIHFQRFSTRLPQPCSTSVLGNHGVSGEEKVGPDPCVRRNKGSVNGQTWFSYPNLSRISKTAGTP